MRGTWQGSGTWQSSGPDLDGLIVPVVICAVVIAVAEFILSIIVWLAIAAGVVLVAAVAGFVWWRRGEPERKARYDAIYAAAFEARRRRGAITADAIPQVSQGTAPAIENHYHVHHHYAAGSEPARAIPGKVLP